MKILIDIQGCQTASRLRGIGRYSLNLAEAIVRNCGRNRIIILANGAFGEDLATLRALFSPRIPPQDFVVFDADFPVAEHDEANEVRCRLAEASRERLIATIAPDVVLILSLFEGFLDDAVTSIGRIGVKPPTAVVLYDLIPYLRQDPNWPSAYLSHYARKIESLRQADLLLSISDYTRREAAEAIPELAPRIVNIASACDPQFNPCRVSAARRKALFHRYGIQGSFLLSSGNVEPRKNFEQIIRAFGLLPKNIRQQRQIVIVGAQKDPSFLRLGQTAEEIGLPPKTLIATGHIPDQDLRDLYRLCELFVFPSKYEGFGLPALEAMSCGAPVIGSNKTSIPEVIGNADAMFDPEADSTLSSLIEKALSNKAFSFSLRKAGLKQAASFSWDKTARRAIKAMREVIKEHSSSCRKNNVQWTFGKRPRLALVSPLPPEQTGIADYMAELLPALSRYYDITVVSDQREATPGPDGEVFDVKGINWFEANASAFARILYQLGNSPFHEHMPDLLARYPGVVVLHDFYLSKLTYRLEQENITPDIFRQILLHAHGYTALSDVGREADETVRFKWPCSFQEVADAQSVILHSNYSRKLIARWYGPQFARKAIITKLPRLLPPPHDKHEARSRLKLAQDNFVCCVFGFMDKTKMNVQLLDAWAHSSLAHDPNCKLIFVGGEANPEYMTEIHRLIASIDNGIRISITGFVPKPLFEDYLSAADIAVQLRTLSRGETSRSVLDCLAFGLPVIINANGSMAEYPDNIAVKLKDHFKTKDLIHALDQMRASPARRQQQAEKGLTYVGHYHTPEATAQDYAETIERCVNSHINCQTAKATHTFWSIMPDLPLGARMAVEQKLSSLIRPNHRPTLYLDLSATTRNDLKTGIERVARALLYEILANPPKGHAVVPVALVEEAGRWRVKCASGFLARQSAFSDIPQNDAAVIPGVGDLLVSLDLFIDGVVSAEKNGLYDYWHKSGAKVGFLIHDLLPITHPQFFPPWAEAMHEAWVGAIIRAADFLICISKHVQSDVMRWMERHKIPAFLQPKIAVSYHGADIESSLPTRGLPSDAPFLFSALAARPSFLMVGTIEPRKGHLEVLKTFDALWDRGVDANLVVVGSEGWKGLPEKERRTIPQIMAALRGNAKRGETLFWLEGISDEYLQEIYKRSTCLIAASEDEGFGLPLIEAARQGIPILARDIPVFREVGGSDICYFSSKGTNLSQAIKVIVGKKEASISHQPSRKPWISWNESAKNFLKLLPL